MAEISAKDVMKLRQETGLSMMECKAALTEADGDAERAKDLLRKKLKGKMDLRVNVAAGEGRVAIAVDEAAGTAAIVEVRAQTDFTAKNDQFIAAVQKIADLALLANSGEVTPSAAMNALIDDLRIKTGENCSVARAHKLSGETGTTAYGRYVHHDGKTGVLIQAVGSINDDTLRDICMHITAAVPRPMGVSQNDIPSDVVDKERRFRIEQAMESGKPKEIAEKIVEGGMRKFFEEVALLEQPFIRDESKKIKDLVGPKAQILAFYRWQVGEATN